MPRLALVLLALSLSAPGCCFGGSGGNTTATPPPVVAPVAIPTGAGVLPTPQPLFAGVDAPYPIPGAAVGVEGYILRSGSATVQSVSGLAGVTVGSQCSYTQYQITSSTLDCRWNVTCGGYVVYGLGTGGYQRCQDPAWPAGTLMFDPNTSISDQDPSFSFNASTISINDDLSGRNGTYSLTLTVP
jgi:hypothetical protein